MNAGARAQTQPRASDSSNSEPSPEVMGVTPDSHPQRVHPKEGYHAAIHRLAQFLIGLVLLIALISTLAQLSGCHITRQWPSAQAPQPTPATMQAASCRAWDECA
jgi:hypothetical protein